MPVPRKARKTRHKAPATAEAALRRPTADVKRRVGKLKKKKRPDRPRKMLIDADILLYQATTQFLKEEGPDENDEYRYVLTGKDVKGYLHGRLDELIRTYYLDEILLCFSSISNWRKQVQRTYKANRNLKKPLGYLSIKEWCKKEFPCEEFPHLEADDILGLRGTDPDYFDGDVIVCSEDKDMATLPVKWLDPRNMENGIVETDERGAFLSHMAQTMTGDAGDNYEGVKGIGPKRAEALLAPVSSKKLSTIWKTVVNAFVKGGRTPEDALRTARVAYILRHGDFDFDTGKVKLWAPPL